MCEQTLKFGDIVVNKKEFHASKQAIALNLVDTNKILFLTNLNTVMMVLNILLTIYMMMRPLCIILPQMSGYVKYFENGGKNMSFKIEDESVYLKYTEIWKKN